jgi:putative membrane-bound dehydrogenase-like protein
MMRRTYAFFAILLCSASAFAQNEIPKASGPRLVVELFAAAPDIVHPIACDFDHKGRLLVIESHTHFAPKDYNGPKFDRIKAFDVAKRGKPMTFFEGTRHTMDLAVHPDGSVYIATRNEILSLRDTKGTGVADEKTRIVFLDTKGDYPHNGLSGLCFDSKGDLYFGMGENLGAAYKLIGADGKTFTGEGDGGHIFHCSADGKKLRRIATGFWNPFGTCRDIYGRLFCVDNDPDQSPPCRMVHVVEGGDYGFQFRYGRSGKHPFQSWHGTLPGTLPMMTGVGEAPCEILSYESDGLPKEYRGQLLVTSWADHRVERYAVKPHGASFKADRLPFVQGGNNFRPVGLCTAPDGSLFVTDWVLPNYELHGKGAIWHIRWKDAPNVQRRHNPREAIFSMHRPLREKAARSQAGKLDRDFLREQLGHEEVRVRAAALAALIDARDPALDLKKIVEQETDLGMREIAVRAIANDAWNWRDKDAQKYLDAGFPASVRVEAIKLLQSRKRFLRLLGDADPFIRHAAVQELGSRPLLVLELADDKLPPVSRERVGILLSMRALRWDGKPLSPKPFLNDPNEEVRFLVAKWIADEKLADYRDDVVKGMNDPKLSVRMYIAYATALARLDGREVSETRLADYFAKRLADDATPPAQRAMLLRQVPATHPKLTIDILAKLASQKDDALRIEALRALSEHPSTKRGEILLGVLRDAKLDSSVRSLALMGLNDRAQELNLEFVELAVNNEGRVRDEALRALVGVKLTVADQRKIEGLARTDAETADLVARVGARPFFKDRPAPKDLDAWMKRIQGAFDLDAGARIFFHPKLGGCYKCHRIDGRGQDVGPDLSDIGNTDRRHILESILQPSNTVAPHYVAWHLETADGKVRNGMLLHTQLDEYTYLDAKGDRFKLKTGDLVEQRPLTVSIMPDGLVDRMTDQEARDLLAYLQARK